MVDWFNHDFLKIERCAKNYDFDDKSYLELSGPPQKYTSNNFS